MQDSELIILETPNHYKAYIKPKLTYGEVKQLKRISRSIVEYDLNTKNAVRINSEKVGDVEDLAMKLYLVKLLDPQGNELPNPFQAMDALDEADGQAIEDKVAALAESLELTKKKVSI